MKPTILLIDDDPMRVMGFYVEALEVNGYRVVKCDNAKQGLNAAQTENPALVVLDVMMPAGELYKDDEHHDELTTGVFLLRDLRKRHPNVPVIVLTNLAGMKTSSLFQADKLLKVLSKPDCPPFELAEEVAMLLGEPDA